jgi:uncharacterized protein (DUF1499 family)
MRVLIWLISLAALGLAAMLAVLGPGSRFGLWDYGTALGLLREIALPLMLAAGLAAIAFALALWKARGLAPLALVAALAAGAAAYVPLQMRAMVEANPFIHDITTDFDAPPEILAAATLERSNPPAYAGADLVRNSEKTVAEAQREAFPDIAPFTAAGDLQATRDAVRAIVEKMGMQILAEGPVSSDPGSGWRIEAVATSFWYGFKDDFIVRLMPLPEGGTRVDVRSKSRVGGSDLGANARRVRAFLKELAAAV